MGFQNLLKLRALLKVTVVLFQANRFTGKPNNFWTTALLLRKMSVTMSRQAIQHE